MADISFPYIIVGYWVSVFLLQMATFFPLSYAMFKKRNKLAFPFILYLCMILIESFSTIVTTVYTIISWRPVYTSMFTSTKRNDPIPIFIIGFISFSFVPVTSAAVFFLLLHRIFAVNFFNAKKLDTILGYSATIVIILMIISNSAYVIIKFLNTLPTWAPDLKCWVIHCIWGNSGSAFHIWCRMIFGFANTFLGIVFLIVLKKASAAKKLRSKRANRLTLITIASELILSFLPTAVDIFLSNLFGIYLVQKIGPLGFLTCAADAFVVSMIYSRFFLKSDKTNTKVNSNTLMK